MTNLVVTRQKRHGIVAIALVVLFASVTALSAVTDSSLTSDRGPLPSESFALFDGREVSFAEFGGKPLVINFWASWCPACVAELPEIQSIHEQYRDDVTILGMANTDERNAALDLAGSVGLTYTLADDPTGDLFRSLDLIAMPSTVFVTSDGEIHEIFGGQLNESALAERIDDLIAAS